MSLDIDDETNNLQYDIVPGDTENSLIEDVLPEGLNNVETFHEPEWRLIRQGLLLTEQKVMLEQIEDREEDLDQWGHKV